jgi:hypothetical protein
MIRAGEDFEANLSTGTCWVMLGDYAGLALYKDKQHIVVPPKNVHGKDYMDSLCHEVGHLSMPKASEEEVARLAGDITEVLWKRGYRLPKPPKRRKVAAS